MLTKLLLDRVRTSLDEFSSAQLRLDGQSFQPAGSDAINSGLVYNALCSEHKAKVTVVLPSRPVSLLGMVVTAAFVELLRDVTDKTSGLGAELVPGEYVTYEGCTGMFKGISILSGQEFGELFYAGNDKVFVPREYFWRMRRESGYLGPSQRYNTHKRTRPRKNDLSEILQLDESALAVTRKSHVAVLCESNHLESALRELYVNGTRFPILFPTAVHKQDQCRIVLGNTDRRLLRYEPMIHLYYGWDDLLHQAPACGLRTVIVDGPSRIRSRYQEINTLANLNSTHTIITLLDTRAAQERENLERVGFKTWTWLQPDFADLAGIAGLAEGEPVVQDLQDTSVAAVSDETSRPRGLADEPVPPGFLCGEQEPLSGSLDTGLVSLNSHYLIIRNLANEKVNVETVTLSPQTAQDALNQFVVDLRDLKRNHGPRQNAEWDDFLRYCYGMLAYFTRYPLPVNTAYQQTGQAVAHMGTEEWLARLAEKVDDVRQRMLPSDAATLLERMLSSARETASALERANPKNAALQRVLLADEEKATLIVDKPRYVSELRDWLFAQGRTDIDVVEKAGLRRMQPSAASDHLVVSGWFGQSAAGWIHSGLARKLTFLVYPHEQAWMNPHIDPGSFRSAQLRHAGIRAQLLGVPVQLLAEPPRREVTADDFGDDPAAVIAEINERSYSAGLQSEPHGDTVDAFPVIFEDGARAYLTDGYVAKKLDRLGMSLERVATSDIRAGDELVFLSDSRRDILEELFKALGEDLKWKPAVKQAGAWRTALHAYLAHEHINTLELTRRLADAGCRREVVTVENWVSSSNTIGPGDVVRAVAAIANLTQDSFLLANQREVARACIAVRIEHKRLGQRLAARIINSLYGGSRRDSPDALGKRLGDLTRHAVVVQVRGIATAPAAVLASHVNRLLDWEE